MEVQQTNDNHGQSLYRQNLLDAMATSSIKYLNRDLDAIKFEDSSMLAQDRPKSISCIMIKMPNWLSIFYTSRLPAAESRPKSRIDNWSNRILEIPPCLFQKKLRTYKVKDSGSSKKSRS